jgi:single-strand DNA-binding protein
LTGGLVNNLNSILLEGNLVRDPLLRISGGGVSVCTFSVASNRSFKKEGVLEEEVSFFDVETWGKLAETCGTLGHKGRGLRVVGCLKQDRWLDKEGSPHSRVLIVAEHVEWRPEQRQGPGYKPEPKSEPDQIESMGTGAEAAACSRDVVDDIPF